LAAGATLAVATSTSLLACHEGSSETGPCIERRDELEPEEEAGPYDLSAKAVLKEIADRYAATLVWLETNERAEVELTIDGTEIDEAAFVFSDENPAFKEHVIVQCYDGLEFKTAARLRTSDDRVLVEGSLAFWAEGPMVGLASLETMAPVIGPDGVPVDAQITLTIQPGGAPSFTGSIGKILDREEPEGTLRRTAEVAAWPADDG